MAAVSSLRPSPTAPKSLTFLISASRSGIVRAVGAPVAGKRKFVKLVSAWARDAASAPTPPHNKSRRPMICVVIVGLPFGLDGSKKDSRQHFVIVRDSENLD